MEVYVDHFYGVYPSRIYGNLLLLDPILPPIKCPLRCIVCPLQGEAENRGRYQNRISVHIERVLSSLRKYVESPIDQFDGLLIWGYGDPLHIVNLFEFLVSTRIIIKELGIKGKIYLHTSAIPLIKYHARAELGSERLFDREYLKSIIESIDALLVPFIWHIFDLESDLAKSWTRDVGLSEYLTSIRELSRIMSDKINLELYLFKLHESIYPDSRSLDEIIALLKYARINKIILKSIDRPVLNQAVKPVSASYLEKTREKLENEGFNVLVDQFIRPTSSFKFKSLYNVIYNHVLRTPLSYAEIRSLYGNSGVIAANNLIEKKWIRRIHWAGEIFYVGNLPK